MDSNTSNPLKKILILAANPKGTSTERLGQELRDIAEGLRRAQKRDQFALEQHLAVRPRDIQRAILDFKPHIVYFSGHGGGEEGLVFEDETGKSKPVSGNALAGLFELFADETECVLLNGCYSEVQAKAIAKHINYVVGMNQAISDRAAIEFAVGFYDALGAGRSIEFAYNWGCIAIRMQGIEEHLTPVLLKKEENGKVKIFVSDFQEGEKLKKFQRQWLRRIPKQSIFTTLSPSLVVTALVVAMRFVGFLQPLELLFYDQMMRLQKDENIDKKLLLIQITDDDLKTYPGTGASLNDKTLSELLKKLLNFNARTIGIDLYRNFEAQKGSELKRLLETETSIFAICKVADTNAGSQGTAPPPEVNKAQIGFSDFLPDTDNVVRRQILRMDNTNIDQEDKCFNRQEVMDSFSFKLFQHYLSVDKNKYNNSGNEIGKLAYKNTVLKKNTVLQRLYGLTAGGYISVSSNLDGYQMLLNYRSVCLNDKSTLPHCSLHKIALRKTVKDVLAFTDKDKELVNDKIVLIGTKVEGIDPPFPTPFKDPDLPGMIMQAQKVSQLLSAVIDGRPLLKVWVIWHETLWILAWSLLGSILALKFSSRKSLFISGTTALFILYILCLFFFISPIKIWAPFVPPALTLLGTGGGVVVLIRFKPQKSS
jgi:CHASE2 domain-containing sensor protein